MTQEPTSDPALKRRVVLHPRTASARRLDRSRIDGGHVRGYTIDTAEVLQYMRDQRRLALRTFLPTVTAIVVLLVTTIAWPGLADIRLGNVNVLWILLGPVTLFTILAVTVRHERKALALEQRWMDQRQ